MIKKLKIGLLSLAVLSFIFVGANSASATVTYSVAQTVDLSSPDINLTIVADSVATSVAVGTGTLTVTVPSGSTFVVTSASRALNADINSTSEFIISHSCSPALLATTTIVGVSSAGTVVLTPAPGQCSYSSGGGGGGGGGSVTPADTTPPTGTSVSINAGVASTSSLSATLTLAATDATQMLISNDSGFAGASWETYATSKSWTLASGDGVKTVYAKFKDATGNMSSAVSDTITVSGSGTVTVVVTPPAPTEGCSGSNQYNTSTGGLCINYVASGAIAGCDNKTSGFSNTTGVSCVGNVVSSAASGKTAYNFGTATLKNGSKGEAVKELQRFLNATMNLGLVVDGAFGPKTTTVMKKWQTDHGLVADGLIGPATKAQMNASVQ